MEGWMISMNDFAKGSVAVIETTMQVGWERSIRGEHVGLRENVPYDRGGLEDV
jgi:hypothetical protein